MQNNHTMLYAIVGMEREVVAESEKSSYTPILSFSYSPAVLAGGNDLV